MSDDVPDWGTTSPSAEPATPAASAEPVTPAASAETAPSAPVFPDMQTWVGEWLVPTIRRPLKSGVVWCAQWWRHPEAVARLDALWRAWEAARAEEAGMSYWWSMHFDSHWAVLSSQDRGPFAACKEGHDPKFEALPCEAPPQDWQWPSDLHHHDQHDQEQP